MITANSHHFFNRLPHIRQTQMSRLVLYAGETRRLDKACQIRILSGQAWITVDDRDIILGEQESAQIALNRQVGLIAAIGQDAVTFEMCED